MNQRDLELLEFPQILTLLERELSAHEGVQTLQEEQFFTNPTELTAFREPVIALLYRLSAGISPFRYSFPHIAESMEVVKREGAVLEGQEITAVGSYLVGVSMLLLWLDTLPEDGSPDRPEELVIQKLRNDITVPKELIERIQSTLDERGEVREDYLPLRALRRELAELYQRQQNLAIGYVHKNPQWFQSNQPAFRNNRVLLPVKSGFRSQLSGAVQDVSASGSTFFMEPPELMSMNNRVTEKQHELMREIQRVYRELSRDIRNTSSHIEELLWWVGRVDTLMARARLGYRWNGVPLGISSQVALHGCSHPLLGGTVVPVDIIMPKGVQGLVISGPNAGGKSVTMKTLGLVTLMNQFGMLIPCAEGSSLPLFPKVFASIGDEQSIERALSTFSGQMSTLAEMCKELTPGSLVILDEIGAGTDPLEGGALAHALIEYLLDRNCLVVATSHHQRVKRFGYLRDDIISGAMEFDENSHKPTYRLMVGQIGDSHGIETALRYGLPKEIIANAKSSLSKEESSLDYQLRSLEQRWDELSKREKELSRMEESLGKQEETVLEERRRVELREAQVKAKEARELSLFLQDSRRNFENLIREIREDELTKDRILQGRKQIAEVSARLESLREESKTKSNHSLGSSGKEQKLAKHANTHSQHALEGGNVKLLPGIKVAVGPSRRKGVLLEEDKRGKWVVQFGSMRMSCKSSEITPIVDSAGGGSGASSGSGVNRSAQVSWIAEELPSPKSQLDIRGVRAEEAISLLQQQLDRALSHNVTTFTILHGTGEGILQKVVAEFLSTQQGVSRFEYAPLEEGGYGKTVVYL